MANLGPWSVQFPINFVANGDTVHQGFNKHIQEIARIYGLLNALDAAMLSANDIAGLTDDHEKLKNLLGGDGSGHYHLTKNQLEKLNGAAGSGDIIKDHNSLSGLQGGTGEQYYHLTKAQVDSLSSMSGITDGSLGENGWVKFGNGLMVQWGIWSFSERLNLEYIRTHKFPTTFTNACFNVYVGTTVRLKQENSGVEYCDADVGFATVSWDKSSCRVLMQDFSGATGNISTLRTSFIAIGN